MNTGSDLPRRTRRYWMVDGLPELLMGSLFLLAGVLQLVSLLAPSNIAGFAMLLVPLLMMVGTLFGRRVLHAVKARLTYPRTGYVEYPQPKRWQQVLGGLLGFGLGMALTALLFTVQFSATWIPVITGFTLALGMVYLGFYMGLTRFYILAVFASILGILLQFLRVDGFLGASSVMALMGVWLLIAGGITLYRYLQRTQAQEQ